MRFVTKFVGVTVLAIGSIFTGAWAGPLGLIIWSGLTVEALVLYGFTWTVLKCCFLGSMGMGLFVYWTKNGFTLHTGSAL